MSFSEDITQELKRNTPPFSRPLAWTLTQTRRAYVRSEVGLSRDFDLTAVLISMAILIATAFWYVKPGVFVVSVMLNDTLLYTESGYRLAHGQIPGIDFSSALGLFAYLPHAVAYRLTGDLVQAIPIASVMLAAMVFAIAVYFALTRLGALVGIGVALTASLMVMAPVVLGFGFWESESMLTTIAMSYNKLGFVLVLLTALLPIKPKPQWQATASRFDAVLSVIMFMLAYYTKMPFGIAVACLVTFWALLLQPDRRQLKIFLMGVPLAVAAMELAVPGLNLAYIKDMAMSFAVVPSHGVKAFIYLSLPVAREVFILAGLPLLAMLAVGRVNPGQVVFYLCLIGGSIVLLSLCSQGAYLVAPLAIPIAATTSIARTGSDRNRLAMWVAVAALAYGLLTYIAPALLAIKHHAKYASSMPVAGLPQAYASLRVPTEIKANLTKLDDAFGGKLRPEEAFAAAREYALPSQWNVLFETEYAHTLVKLVDARNLCGKSADRFAILDFANPSSSLFGLAPVSGYTYAHFDRSFSLLAHWAPERMFRDVDCLLDPKLPQGPEHREGLWSVYGSYLTKTFQPAGETDYWRVFVRRGAL